jgi:Cu2+-exporting ATPase
MGQILREVERSASRRAPIVRAADALAGRFVAAVLVLAALTWWRWHFAGATRAFDNTIALLIATCPCALALATPLAITVAIGRAARRGILVKGGDALESLARPATLVLDKTGTLTEGRIALAAWEGSDDAQRWTLALERHSSHPIAAGFLAAWPHLATPAASDVRATSGGGLEGLVEGHRVLVGSPAWVGARARDPRGLASAAADVTLTPVLVAVDGEVVARAGLGDVLRADAAETLAALRRAGWTLRLLSGDAPAVVAAVGARLGFEPSHCRGGASPEDKLAEIESLARSGRVVMVGDGVNDAAAIARATVGVGVKGGAEACLAAADVFLSRPGLAPLAELVDGSARTLRTIRTGILVSILYNVLGVGLAFGGVINPLIAAFMMPASSLTVVLIAWRSRTFSEGAGWA